MDKIPVFKPLIESEELTAATRSLEIGWLGMGKSVGEFEERLAEHLGLIDRHVVAVSTGHAALHLALLLADVGPGDEVITPSFNNIADFQAIFAVGATPVLCDIRNDTLCIDVEKAAACINTKTKAIIATDYGCFTADHDALNRLASVHGIRVIHDAAHSIGSLYNGKQIGSFSDIAIFSFDPVKTITCIDGGALVVKSQEEVERLHRMRLIGMGQPAAVMYGNQRAWTYDVECLGFRYHMANLHAAVGLAQLAKIDVISLTRRAACLEYNQRLQVTSAVNVPRSKFEDGAPFLYYIRVPDGDRQSLRDHLSGCGIDTGIHWQPGHSFTLLKDVPKGDLEVTENVGKEILSLPLHSKMALGAVERISNAIIDYFNGTGGR